MRSMLICFFKQKTAYDMRISDWSSDVCSSDLIVLADDPDNSAHAISPPSWLSSVRGISPPSRVSPVARRAPPPAHPPRHRASPPIRPRRSRPHRSQPAPPRSEEHTSELQSLMRTSYAVFCLKKKKTKHNNQITNITQ